MGHIFGSYMGIEPMTTEPQSVMLTTTPITPYFCLLTRIRTLTLSFVAIYANPLHHKKFIYKIKKRPTFICRPLRNIYSVKRIVLYFHITFTHTIYSIIANKSMTPTHNTDNMCKVLIHCILIVIYNNIFFIRKKFKNF